MCWSNITLKDGKTLDDVLQPETVEQLKAHLASKGLPYDALKSLNPTLVGLTISIIELQAMGITVKGVDEHFEKMGSKDGKSIAYFETVEQQIGFLLSMAKGQEDAFISYSIAEAANAETTWNAMLEDWRTGNMEDMNNEILVPLEKDYPQINDVLITNRNNDWVPKIEALFEDKDTEFVLVGALHLAGKSGLLNQLEEAGYKVTKVQ